MNILQNYCNYFYGHMGRILEGRKMGNPERRFEWVDIGDILKGRPSLGENMNVAAYRMLLHSIRYVLEKNFGKEEMTFALIEAGQLAGIEFCKNMLDIKLAPDKFFRLLKEKVEELGIGLFEVEYADLESMIFILTVSEDLDCSGIPATGETVCNYDEGFIMGILEMYTGKQFMVRETECWSTGHWICRFNVVAI